MIRLGWLALAAVSILSSPAWAGGLVVQAVPAPANSLGGNIVNPPGAAAVEPGANGLMGSSFQLPTPPSHAVIGQLDQIKAEPVAALKALKVSPEPRAAALYQVLSHPESIAGQKESLTALLGPETFKALAETVEGLAELAGRDSAVRKLLSSGGDPAAALDAFKRRFDGAAEAAVPGEAPVAAVSRGPQRRSIGLARPEPRQGESFDPRPMADSPFQYIEKGGKKYLELKVGGLTRTMELGEGGPRAPEVRFVRKDVVEVRVGDKPFLVKLTEDNLRLLADMMAYLSDPDPALANLMLRGDMGTGKNTLVYTLAGLLNQGVRVMSFHAHTSEKDLRYRTTLGEERAGETSRKHSELYEGAQAGDWVILDEPNKPLQIGILNSLNTILQNRRETLPGEDRPVAGHARFRAIALINPPNRSYTVQEMPADFIRRFNVMDVDYMKAADEADFVMDTVFLDESAAKKEQLRPLIEQLVGLANDLRSSYRQGHLPRPMSTRAVLAMAWHIKKFPKDFPYFREIFDPVYPTEYLEQNEAALVEEYLRQHDLQGRPRPADFTLPDIELDERAGKARLGDEKWGVVELPLGDLKAEDVPEGYRDIPHLQANLRLWWALMKDRALGRHSLVLGETGTGKTQLTGHYLYALLRLRPEEQTFTRQTRGQDITGKPELKDDATYWPPYPLERAVDRDTTWLVDEVTKPEDPGTVSLLNNVLQFGQILLPSGKVLNAGKGFSVVAMGTPARAQYEAQEFSGEVLDRFSTHILRPLPADQELGLVEAYAAKHGLDVKRPVLEALQRALDSLRESYRKGLLPAPPSVQALFRVVSYLGRFPDTKSDIVRTFLRAFPAWESSHEDVIRLALAPVAEALGLAPAQAQAQPQAETARALTGSAADVMDESKVGIAARFVDVAPGEFEMGSPTDEARRVDNEALHPVKLTRGFQLQAAPVTQRQWTLLMGKNPSTFKTTIHSDGDHMVLNGQEINADHPVENVSWDEAQEFIRRLNDSQTEYTYRLPTEAEWEYAARAGTKTPYWFDAGEIDDHAWHLGNSGGRTHAVGKAAHANPWDLHDMLGNVWQWLQDWYGIYPTASVQGMVAADPAGPKTGATRVVRGGSWNIDIARLRSAARSKVGFPAGRWPDVGFRLARTRRSPMRAPPDPPEHVLRELLKRHSGQHSL